MSVAVLPPPTLSTSSTRDATLSLPLSISRPPLIRKGTSYTSNASNGTTQSQGCRLLWRGKIITEQGIKLHGIAIIAHLFSVPSTNSTSTSTTASPQTPSSFSPFDDPFSSSSKATSSGADMCLGLEMLRGKDLPVVAEHKPFSVRVQAASDTIDSSPEVERKASSARKGKGKEVLEEVKVETPTDVRVYIDQRCPETVEWFQDRFCREGGQSSGLRLDAGGEQVVVFASIPDHPSDRTSTTPTNSPSTSTSAAATSNETLPPLTLLLGRPIKPIARRPRPDDPLPRESLFTAKLRKTASLPASAFSKTSLSSSTTSLDNISSSTNATKKNRLSSKDKAIASLLGKNPPLSTCDTISSNRGRQTSNPPPSIAFPLPAPQKRSLSRSLSTSSNTTSRLFSNNSRQSSLPPGNLATSNPNGRPFKRSKSSIITHSTSSSSSNFLLVDSPPHLDNDNDLDSHTSRPISRRDSLGLPPSNRSRSVSRGPSPTPSIASTSFNYGIKEEEEEEGDGEESDRLAELRDVGIKRQRSVNGGMGMKRSLSLPSGKFLGGNGENARVKKEEMEGKVIVGSEAGGVEVRNKNTIKRMTMTRMQTIGIGRDHEEFRDMFSLVTRGVGFALRSTFKRSVLSVSERELAESLIEQHLRLYLPSSHFVNPLPMSMSSTKATFDQHQNGSLKPSLENEDGKVSLQDQFDSRGIKEGSSDTIVGEGDGDGEVREEEAGKPLELLSKREVTKDADDDDETMLEATQVVETQMQ